MKRQNGIQYENKPRFRIWYVIVAAVAIVTVIFGMQLYNAFTALPKETLQTTGVSGSVSAYTVLSQVPSAAPLPTATASPKTEEVLSQAVSTPLSVDEKIAYLTFDDGPSEYTPKLLDILQENNIKATFFVTFFGHDSPTKRGWVQEEMKDGETIGEHSWTHDYSYIYASEQNFMTDFNTMKQILTNITGTQPVLFRFPGGVGNTVWRTYHNNVPIMDTLVQDVESAGMTPFDWTAGGQDTSGNPPSSPRQFCNEIMDEVGNQKHPIILMHDRIENSVNTVPLLISALREKGYSFGTLSHDMAPVLQKVVAPK